MNKSDFPSFHKKNILKRASSSKIYEDENLEELKEDLKPEKEDYNFALKTLSCYWKDEKYPELEVAIEFFNTARYETALRLFKQRPADPGRFLKNAICTFYGPIGWLLMANTKIKKDNYINFCIACCQYHLGQYSEALDSIKNNYASDEFLYLKAWCQYKLGKHSDAKDSFKKAFYINPKLIDYEFPYKENEVL